MAFITEATFKYLYRGIHIEKEQVIRLLQKYLFENKEDIKYIDKLLNSLDKEKIAKQIFLLLNENENKEIMVEYREYQSVPEREDNLRYIFNTAGKVCYHLYKDCERLNKGFINLNTPPEFFNLEEPTPKEAVEDLRNWAIENGFKPESFKKEDITSEKFAFILENFIMRFNAYFPKKYENAKYKDSVIREYEEAIKKGENFNYKISRLNITYPLLEIKESSGHRGNTDDNTSDNIFRHYKEMIKKLQGIAANIYELCNFKEAYRLLKHNYLYDKSDLEIDKKLKELNIDVSELILSIDNLKVFFKNAYDLKTEVIDIITKHIYWKFNFEQRVFDSQILQQYNLKVCQKCLSRKGLEWFDELS